MTEREKSELEKFEQWEDEWDGGDIEWELKGAYYAWKEARRRAIEECAALLEREYKECTTDDDRAMVGMCAPATLRALLK